MATISIAAASWPASRRALQDVVWKIRRQGRRAA
jgi:hypothetical protein